MSLYNKYRPQGWDSVIGQDGIVETLKNAIAYSEIPSTYLFHGPRGTGKTTCARIFAKALNCESPIAPGVPCTKCQNCLDIADDRSPYVTEIDSASNTGVDNMRDIKVSANMVTSGDCWRVYIFDECHMLSKAAMNSALKLFEESPGKTIFVMATTELHKVEGTIISRSLRFDFRPVGILDLVKRLQFISNSEGIESDDAALKEIAKAGRGSVRDSITIFERVSLENTKKINMQSVIRTLGITPVEIMVKMGDVLRGDYKRGFEVADKIITDGYDIHTFLQGAMDYCRDLLMVKMGVVEGLMVEPELMASLQTISNDISIETVTNAINILDETVTKYRYNDNKQVLIEMSLYKIAKPQQVVQPAVQVQQQRQAPPVQMQQPAQMPPVQVQQLQQPIIPIQQPLMQQQIVQGDTISSPTMSAPVGENLGMAVQGVVQQQMSMSDYQRVCKGWEIYLGEVSKASKDAGLWLQTGCPKSFDYDEFVVEFPSDAMLNVMVFNDRFSSISGKVLSRLMEKPVTVKAVVEMRYFEQGGDGDTIDSSTYEDPSGGNVMMGGYEQVYGNENMGEQQVSQPLYNEMPMPTNVAVYPSGNVTQSNMGVVQQVVAPLVDSSPVVTPDFLMKAFGDGSKR